MRVYSYGAPRRTNRCASIRTVTTVAIRMLVVLDLCLPCLHLGSQCLILLGPKCPRTLRPQRKIFRTFRPHTCGAMWGQNVLGSKCLQGQSVQIPPGIRSRSLCSLCCRLVMHKVRPGGPHLALDGLSCGPRCTRQIRVIRTMKIFCICWQPSELLSWQNCSLSPLPLLSHPLLFLPYPLVTGRYSNGHYSDGRYSDGCYSDKCDSAV